MTVGSRIKANRKLQKYTLKDVSKKSGLSVGYLSKLERSDKIPPLSTLQLIASTLKVSASELLEGYEPSNPRVCDDNDITIFRSKHDQTMPPTEEGYTLIPLTNNYPNRGISPFMMHIPPGKTYTFEHDAEEFNFVVRGPVKLHYKDTEYLFSEGDSFYFDSRKPHILINENDYPVLVLSVVYMYRKF